jgi:hypothetical protein
MQQSVRVCSNLDPPLSNDHVGLSPFVEARSGTGCVLLRVDSKHPMISEVNPISRRTLECRTPITNSSCQLCSSCSGAYPAALSPCNRSQNSSLWCIRKDVPISLRRQRKRVRHMFSPKESFPIVLAYLTQTLPHRSASWN